MNRIGKNPSLDLPAVTFIVMAAAALLLAVDRGAGVFGGPDSCQQPQAIRDALENATGLACAEIGSADLRDIRVLDLRGERLHTRGREATGYSYSHRISKLQPSAFNGLERLERLYLSGNRLTELLPGVFDGLENLRVLDMSWQNHYDFRLYLSGSVPEGLTELPPGVFESLTNLEFLDLSGNGSSFTITHPNADLVCRGCEVVPP